MDAHDWDSRYEGADLLWSAKPNRFLVAEVGDLAPGRALDLACGEGRNAIWLAERGWDVTGIDFSAVALDKARRLAEHRGVSVDWVHTDLMEWEPEPGAYDLVLWLYLHVPPAERSVILDRAVTALAQGGTLLVVGHHLDNLERGWGGPQDPGILLHPEEVAGEIRARGAMTIEKADTMLRPVEGEPGDPVAVDALIRAHRE